MDGIGELIEKLCIANLKLWAVCDQKDAYVKSGEQNAERLRDLMKKDLDLCKTRAELRREINVRLGGPQGDNVKCYGKDSLADDEVAEACGQLIEPLPCPLCGHEADAKAVWDNSLGQNTTRFFIKCPACDCKTVQCDSIEGAWQLWNDAPMREPTAPVSYPEPPPEPVAPGSDST